MYVEHWISTIGLLLVLSEGDPLLSGGILIPEKPTGLPFFFLFKFLVFIFGFDLKQRIVDLGSKRPEVKTLKRESVSFYCYGIKRVSGLAFITLFQAFLSQVWSPVGKNYFSLASITSISPIPLYLPLSSYQNLKTFISYFYHIKVLGGGSQNKFVTYINFISHRHLHHQFQHLYK